MPNEMNSIRIMLRYSTFPIIIILCKLHLDPFHHKEAGYWDFEDHSLRNTALGASTIGNGANYHGVITTAPDRKGKVMQCSGTQWNVDCFAAPVATSLNTPCLT